MNPADLETDQYSESVLIEICKANYSIMMIYYTALKPTNPCTLAAALISIIVRTPVSYTACIESSATVW